MGCGNCKTGGGCSSGDGCGSGGGCKGCTNRLVVPTLHVFDWLNDYGINSNGPAFDLVEVIFKGRRKGIYRNTQSLDIQTGDFVLVEADRGQDFGTVYMTGELVRLRIKTKEKEETETFPAINGLASLADIEHWETLRDLESEAFYIAREAIERLDLDMKMVDVEWQFDKKKVTFYFTSDHRVDFRQLVRDLARKFRTRVELRQIGARDETARLGGIGACGRELCCSTWLQDFKPVSTQAAKIQSLPLNPARLAGQCGRLKCCLNYELEQYMTVLNDFPRLDTPITTPHGRGTIQRLDIFNNLVGIQYGDGFWEDLPLAQANKLLEERRSGSSRKPHHES